MSQKFNSSPKAGRLETQEELMFQIGSKRQGIKTMFQFKGSQVAGISLNLGYVCGGCGAGVCCFVLLKPSTDCMGSTHIMESSLLYSEPTNFNVHFYPNHSDRIIQNNVPINIWALWPRQIDTKN